MSATETGLKKATDRKIKFYEKKIKRFDTFIKK